MTALKLQSRPSSAAAQALQPHVQQMYDRPGRGWILLAEVQQVERTEPAPAADKDRSVTMRITSCEVPTGDQEGSVRDVMRALFLERTATGTLDESGDLQLAKQTIRDAAGIVQLHAIARLSAGVAHWQAYVARVCGNQRLTVRELRHELAAISQRQTTINDEED
jgi:hypothetical protein